MGLLLAQHLDRRQQCRAAVARCHVVVAQGAVAAGLVADEAEQVVAEETAVGPADDEGLILRGLHLSECLGLAECLVVVGGGNLGVAVDVELWYMVVEIAQHRVVYGAAGGVVGRVESALQPVDGGLQRVGRHHALCAGVPEFGLQHLAVGLLVLGLVGYLPEHLLFGLGQVLVLGVLHLSPKVAIGLTE